MTYHDPVNTKSEEICLLFKDKLESIGEQGDIGFAGFESVYDSLMPIQQEKLRSITGDSFNTLLNEGSFISIGIVYRIPFIDFIDSKVGRNTDFELWNQYAMEYHRLNQLLNGLAREIAAVFDGIPLTATIGGLTGSANHVSDYFGRVISHRTIAEHAGLGWRGKNQLTIHERFSCAIRFASIIYPNKLRWATQQSTKCGNCTACEDACSFIKNRDRLPDYRENCRRYILYLKSQGIEKSVCGKCIKACYRSSIHTHAFSLPR
ncbi:MAG: hypothetical protein ACFFFK_11065 [Candidatus Thorarchaeota archaeon]